MIEVRRLFKWYLGALTEIFFLSQSIEEVGGYVLIGINYVDVIPLENLRLIRGHSLFDGKYGLAVVANFHRNESLESNSITSGLRELHMRSLTGKAFIFIHLVDVFIQSNLRSKRSMFIHPQAPQCVEYSMQYMYKVTFLLFTVIGNHFSLFIW